MLFFNMVEQFHIKIQAKVRGRLQEDVDPEVSKRLRSLSTMLAGDASKMLEAFKKAGDHRALRAHLIVEEVGEALQALAEGDEERLLDALADLQYVTQGTAVTYDLPLEEAFTEVHRSNMTKEPQISDPDRARVRAKGPNYSPPDLRSVLHAWRGDLQEVRTQSVEFDSRVDQQPV